MRMQREAEQAVHAILPYPGDPEAALVSLDPRDGRIKAMVGGRGYFAPKKKDRFAKLNLATLAEPNAGPVTRNQVTGEPIREAPGTGRQAGSSFKPFALSAALIHGLSLAQTYDSGNGGCMDFPGADNGKTWHVCNYEQETFGRISLLDATVHSVNV